MAVPVAVIVCWFRGSGTIVSDMFLLHPIRKQVTNKDAMVNQPIDLFIFLLPERSRASHRSFDIAEIKASSIPQRESRTTITDHLPAWMIGLVLS
jgi:hypothetical protein